VQTFILAKGSLVLVRTQSLRPDPHRRRALAERLRPCHAGWLCGGLFPRRGTQTVPPRTGLQLGGHSPRVEGYYGAQSLSDEVSPKAPCWQLL